MLAATMGMPGKALRKGKAPRQLAVIDQAGCTGCEVCITVCPVDSLEIVPGVEHHENFMKLLEVDYDRCIGCSLCAQVCPWDVIDMLPHDEALARAPERTMRSIVPGQIASAPDPHKAIS
jgi:formate hydrogenlyase subunit 6/NADH:ubiquinone oxidoreductase subunit I